MAPWRTTQIGEDMKPGLPFANVSIRKRETRTVFRGSRKALRTILILTSAVSLLATLGAAQSQSSDTAADSGTSGSRANGPTTIATYPVGTILENIAIGYTGDLFVTAIDSGTICRVSPAGASRVFGKVEGSLLGLAF